MTRPPASFLLAALAASASAAPEGGAPPGVVTLLTPESWAGSLDGRRWLVYFTVRGCEHCKRMGPMMEMVAAKFDPSHDSHQSDDPRVGVVDASEHNGLARTFGVKKYPTVLLFDTDGFHYEFVGGRSAQTIMNFALGGYKRHGGHATPRALLPNRSELWMLGEVLWEPFKKSLMWALGLALGIKGVATLLLRMLKPAADAEERRQARATGKKE